MDLLNLSLGSAIAVERVPTLHDLSFILASVWKSSINVSLTWHRESSTPFAISAIPAPFARSASSLNHPALLFSSEQKPR